MELANGGRAPNGGVVDADEEKVRRRRKVGFLDRKGGSMPIEQQQKEEEARLISSSLTESDALKEDDVVSAEAEPNTFKPNHHKPEKVESSKEVELADIAKDLKKIKRQNKITHILLGAVIVMTAVWQVNEVSFLIWVHRKISNPFKSLGDLITAPFKFKKRSPAVLESSPLPPVGIPDVTRTDLPTFVISGAEQLMQGR